MQSLFLIIMSNVEIQRKVVSNSKNKPFDVERVWLF